MKQLSPPALLTGLALALVSIPAAQAAVIVTLPTPTVAGSIVITNDIAFTITTAGTVGFLILDEWVTSDGANNPYLTGIAPASLNFALNAESPAAAPLRNFYDNIAASEASFTPNDGYFAVDFGVMAALNYVMTLKAQTLTLAAGSLPAGFNPQANQTFTGNMFLASQKNAIRLTANTPVPEPSGAVLLLGGLLGLVLRRRR